MIKNIAKLCAIASLFACGAAPEDDLSDAGDAGAELGSVGQAYTSRFTPNFQLGTRTAASHRQCNRTTSSQVCSIPKSKNITYCINPGFTQSDYNLILGQIQAYDNLLSGYTFTFENDIFTGECLLSNFFQVSPGSCGTSGTGSANIENYGCVTLSGTKSLTEGQFFSAPVGNYQTHSFARAKIDITDINAKFSTTAEKNAGKKHAADFVILSGLLGLGSRDDGGSNTFGSRSQIAGFELGLLTAGEKCRAESLNTTDNGDFSQVSACPTVD